MVTIDTKLSYVRALNSWGIISKGNDNLPALMNVALFIDNDKITAVATNRYSIVQHSTVVGANNNIEAFTYGSYDDGNNESEYVLIPFAVLAQFVKAASANKNGEMPVQIRIADDYVEVQMFEILVRGAKIKGQYPRVDRLMLEKKPAVNGYRTFGLPMKEFGYLPKLIAPNANRKPADYDYAVTFSDSSSPDKAGPLVFTTDSDKDFMVVIQPRLMNGVAWMGATNVF